MKYAILLAVLAAASPASADVIVARIVSAPLSADGLVKGAPTGINILLQKSDAMGGDFMDPMVVGYPLTPGGIEIELSGDYARDPDVAIAQPTVMVLSGVPQQGMPGSALGYTVSEGKTPMTIKLTPTDPNGVAAEAVMAPGGKNDPHRSKGIKVFHVGLFESAFSNDGDSGTVSVRFLDADGNVVHEGSANVDFLDAPEPQVFINNFADGGRNHNWQSVSAGATLGSDAGTLPLAFVAYEVPAPDAIGSKDGLIGIGVMSRSEIDATEAEVPSGLERYTDGLVLQDTKGDGRLSLDDDRIIGGVTVDAPEGAGDYELKSLIQHGARDLTRPSAAYHARFGPIFGGGVGLLQFTTGGAPGLYRPAIHLLRDPSDPTAGDSATAEWTVRVN